MNIFKIPRLDAETSKKLGNRILAVFVVAIVCFIASLVVRLFVLNRIEDSRNAFQGINNELPTLMVKTSRLESEITSFDISTKTQNTQSSEITKQVAKSPDIQITLTPEEKILGKQKFVSFDAQVKQTESFYVPQEPGVMLYVPAFSESDVKNFVVNASIDGQPVFIDNSAIKDGMRRNEYKLSVPNGLAGKKLDLAYSWETNGSRKVEFETGNYSVKIIPNWKNVRITGSDYGHFDKNAGTKTAVFNFDNSYQTDYRAFNMEKDYAGVDVLSGPDDITLVDRITKYAILVIALTFFIIFLLDMRRKFVVNIVQYVLVGVSLCLFYLLNLSLGEQIGFTVAYVIATAVTMLINGAYVGTFMDSKKYGLATATGLLVIYALIYWLIKMESINLLAGTILLYAVLIIMMIYTAGLSRSKIRQA